jgi:hypothetical protein
MATRLVLLAFTALGFALPASGQEGLRPPGRVSGYGLDPSYVQDWLHLERRLGLAPSHWRDSIGFVPASRVQWSYPIGQYSLGMSLASGRDYESAPVHGTEVRQYGFFGRYSLTSDWSVNAEAVSRDAGTVFRLQDFRIGVRRQF